MGLRISCLVHVCALLLLAGCAAHRRVAVSPDDDEIFRGRSFIATVDSKMPLWDADEAYARLETVEIATVKADIAMATIADTKSEFLEYVAKLHTDWDLLCARDAMLRLETMI